RQQGLAGGGRRCKPLFLASLPPFVFGPAPAPPRCHAGPFRLLSFGRLLPYKGLDLLAEALVQLGPRADLQVRVVGSGPESETLRQLRMLPGVAVENRWVPEDEVGSLLAWADGLVLSHKEASQSGVAAAAVAAGRWVLATRVGGLVEQLQYETLAVFCDPNPLSLASALGSLLAAPPPSLQPSRDPHAAWRNVAESLIAQIESTLLPGSGGKPCRSMPSIITSRICQNRANSGSPLMRT
ncbi:MAG: glycosyltransferase, partial [Acetobacteraceae bacterium]|nr:glycosyltransferase [Acetobacteraceae bacterium]